MDLEPRFIKQHQITKPASWVSMFISQYGADYALIMAASGAPFDPGADRVYGVPEMVVEELRPESEGADGSRRSI